MPDIYSLGAFQQNTATSIPGERLANNTFPITPSPQGFYPNTQMLAQESTPPPRPPTTRLLKAQQLNTSSPLRDVPTTQSLIEALQSTMAPPPQAVKKPIVIPGNKKRTKNTAGIQRIDRTQKAVQEETPVRRLSPRLRLIIVLIAIIIILLISLLSLTPLGKGLGPTGSGALSGVIQWVQYQQQNMNLAMSNTATGNQDQANAPAAPANPAQPAAANLPKSQYVAIAQQAAISAGIPADYFVKQINQESGFNPAAISPSGAVGIAQFLPSTAAGLGINPYDPVQALNGSAHYMARLYNQYGGDYAKALAAYNAGSGTVQNAINLGGANWMNFLPGETRNYIRVIMGI